VERLLEFTYDDDCVTGVLPFSPSMIDYRTEMELLCYYTWLELTTFLHGLSECGVFLHQEVLQPQLFSLEILHESYNLELSTSSQPICNTKVYLYSETNKINS